MDSPKGNSKKRYLTPWSLAGLVVGAIGGCVYYLKVGCVSGSCPIWSSPWLSMGWGAAMGYLLGDLIPYKKKAAGDGGEAPYSPEEKEY